MVEGFLFHSEGNKPQHIFRTWGCFRRVCVCVCVGREKIFCLSPSSFLLCSSFSFSQLVTRQVVVNPLARWCCLTSARETPFRNVCVWRKGDSTGRGRESSRHKAIIWKPIVSLHKWWPFFFKKKYKSIVFEEFFLSSGCNSISISEREREFPGKNKSSGTCYWEIYKFQVFERVQGYCVFYSFYITTLWMFVCLFLTSIFSIPCLFDE